MKKRILKLIAFAALIAVMLAGITACEEEVVQPSNDESKPECLSENLSGDSVVGEVRIRIPRHNGLSKGLSWDQYGSIETGKAYFRSIRTKTFETMKVYRQSDPSKYFYVMTKNLDIPYPYDLYLRGDSLTSTTESWYYANDPDNIGVYGWLYTRSGAKAMQNNICMDLVCIKNGMEDPRGKTPVRGRLMTRRDMADILEVADIEDIFYHHDVEESESWGKNGYYSAFVFGLGWSYPEDDHSLGGYRDKYHFPSEKELIKKQHPVFNDYELSLMYDGFFAEKKGCGRYWMAEDRVCNYLHIYRYWFLNDTEEWTAYFMKSGPVENGHPDYGFSVRYVFDPFL